MHTPTNIHHQRSKCSRMPKNSSIKEAIDDLKSQEQPNLTATAEKYKIDRTTLSRRFKGETVSYDEACSRTHKLLTNAQESVLIEHCRKLSDRGMHPTPQILRNLVVEIVKGPVGENWVNRFCQRYKDQLTSIYLRSIDQTRKIADNSKYFENYFTRGSV